MKRLIAGISAAAMLIAAAMPVLASEDKLTIYVASDSTAQKCNPAQYPQTGWGQVLASRFTDDIVIENRAMGARSAKKFDDEGRLDKILDEIKPGDYLFIQFGIHDGEKNNAERYLSTDDYKKRLKERYIDEAEKRDAIPVLMTPCAQLSWDEKNLRFKDTRTEYSDATRELAKETGCRFIDINRLLTDTYNTMDKDKVFSCYMICEPLESAQKAIGTNDRTNFKDKGARLVTKLIAEAIPEKVPGLTRYLKKTKAFIDISGHWAEKEIKLAQENEFVNGNGEGRFNPDAEVTRAEFLKMAMNAAGIPGHGYRAGECLEAGRDDWYSSYLQSALDKGLIPDAMLDSMVETEVRTLAEATAEKDAVIVDVANYKCGFKANMPITREEMAVIAMNCLSHVAKSMDKKLEKPNSMLNIADPDISFAYQNKVKEAYAYGLIDGAEGSSFAPKDNVTRAQAAAVINRIDEKLK